MISITAQDLLVAHIHICHMVAKPSNLQIPQVLNDIENQLKTNLSWFSGMQAAAYIGLQIIKRRPFEYANDATATALTMAIAGLDDVMIKTDKDILLVNSILDSSSVVDDVVDELALLGESE